MTEYKRVQLVPFSLVIVLGEAEFICFLVNFLANHHFNESLWKTDGLFPREIDTHLQNIPLNEVRNIVIVWLHQEVRTWSGEHPRIPDEEKPDQTVRKGAASTETHYISRDGTSMLTLAYHCDIWDVC